MAASQQPLSSSRLRHVLTMIVLCLAGGTIFNVVYVFEVYYLPTQQALNLTNVTGTAAGAASFLR